MTNRHTYAGHTAAPGIALGFLHRTDRSPSTTALPHRTGGDAAQQITDAFDAVAHRHNRQVSVCGDAAADPLVTPLLIGLGCDILSVAPAAVDEVRARIRRLRHDTCASLAAIALTRETPEEVWRLVEQCCQPSLP
ncbi:putative PEP-binding protein [Streptomyces sp. NBC_01750]|uniref:putative PEP-binding protein n=1 Tax=Streptomyces sp. NBC_01750 TaxID=2975928 RepID=UPI002DDB6466|nr:putative PEP-binding protein [Streptomyces sp. NBC_01750]WSD37440.1 hypothetical protein OG966_39425 [Streptomyces sp. NBC_01750]